MASTMIISRLQLAFSEPFTIVFNVGMMITLGIPMLAYMIARLTNEQYQQDGNNNNNQEQDMEQYYAQNYDQDGNYIGSKKWWQFWKSSNGQQEEQDGREQNMAPWWYFWGDEREGEPDRERNGPMIFIYIWTLLLIAGLIYLANTTNMETPKLTKLRWALMGFVNYCLVTMILLSSLEGGIQVEGRELEEDGWYGQTSVLVFLTCLFGLVQSIAFIAWTGKRIGNKEEIKSDDLDGYVDVGEEGYNGTTV